MEIKIGIQDVAREVTIDVDADAASIQQQLSAAMPDGLFTVTDSKGRVVIVPVQKMAYLDISTSVSGTVGFRS